MAGGRKVVVLAWSTAADTMAVFGPMSERNVQWFCSEKAAQGFGRFEIRPLNATMTPAEEVMVGSYEWVPAAAPAERS